MVIAVIFSFTIFVMRSLCSVLRSFVIGFPFDSRCFALTLDIIAETSFCCSFPHRYRPPCFSYTLISFCTIFTKSSFPTFSFCFNLAILSFWSSKASMFGLFFSNFIMISSNDSKSQTTFPAASDFLNSLIPNNFDLIIFDTPSMTSANKDFFPSLKRFSLLLYFTTFSSHNLTFNMDFFSLSDNSSGNSNSGSFMFSIR